MCHMHYRDRAPRAPIMDYTGSIHNEKDFAVYKGIAYNESLRSRTESIGKNIVADLEIASRFWPTSRITGRKG